MREKSSIIKKYALSRSNRAIFSINDVTLVSACVMEDGFLAVTSYIAKTVRVVRSVYLRFTLTSCI